MKRFKFQVIVLALVMALTLTGCGPKEEAAPSTEPATEETQAAETQQEDKPVTLEMSPAISEAVNAYFANMPADIYKIPEQDVVDKVKAGEDIFVLDIRQAKDYEAGHLKGAVNLPWGTAISDNLDKLPADKMIAVYCYSGQTAGQTVALLNMAGYNAKSVNLGWNWGISKVEGVAEVTETTANELVAGVPADTDPKVKEAIAAYYQGLADVKETTYANYKINEDDLKELVDAKDDSIAILSVRKAEDYAKGHIEGATNIPFGPGMESQFDTLPQGKKIVVYCYTGQTAGQTVAGLRLLGYDAVSLNAGMGTPATGEAGWANKGYPVVTE